MTNVNDLVRQSLRVLRGTTEQAGRLAGRGLSGAAGQVQRARGRGSAPKDLDDVTLARKVESIAFRETAVPKGDVDVNVVDGVVELRGQVKDPATVRGLEAAVRAIPEVADVENLLHLPRTPSPTRADTPRRQQKQSRRTTPRRTRGKVSGDRTSDLVGDAEQTGQEAATERRGRRAAPMGSQGETPGPESAAEAAGESAREAAGESVRESSPTAAARTTTLNTGTPGDSSPNSSDS